MQHTVGYAGPDSWCGTGDVGCHTGYTVPYIDKTVALPWRVSEMVKIKPCPVHHYFVESLAFGTFLSLFLTLTFRGMPGFKKYCSPCEQGHGTL